MCNPPSARHHLFATNLVNQFDGEGVEEEADSVVNQVLQEIGLDIDGKMQDAPTGAPAVVRPTAESETKLDAKTEEMLRQLEAL